MAYIEHAEVTVFFFAKSRELAGVKEAILLFSKRLTSRDILNNLVEHFSSLSVITETIVLSLNEDYLEVNNDIINLKTGDEIGVIPPISGGCKIMDHVDIIEGKISVEHAVNLVVSPCCGAVSTFLGTTRDNFEGKQVLRLEYEAYIPMAKKKMLEICQMVRQRWNVENIAMIHRIGLVPVKEASIIIAISSPHRKESLEAVHYSIDTLKAIVPVWKKEVYVDDTTSWKENKEWNMGKLN